jgi:hypothetical protein
LDEIPLTLSYDSQMPQAEDMESPNSHEVVAIGWDEILSTWGVDAKMPSLLTTEVNLFHMIFDLNGVLIITHFNRSFHTINLYFGLKEFLEKCLTQLYIWFAT